MTSSRDPIERLRQADPVAGEEDASPHEPRARLTFHRITSSGPPEMRTEMRRRRRIWVLVPVAVVLLVAAGYGIYRSVTEPLVITCFQQARLYASRVEVEATGANPVGLCAAPWRPGGDFNPSGHVVTPELAACVLSGGTIGVFPTTPDHDVCHVLGLERAPPGSNADVRALARFRETIATAMLRSCYSRTEAVALVRAKLQEAGLGLWRVQVSEPFTDSRPCASPYIDSAARIVRIVPIRHASP
jgi:hypothetical protein